MKNLIFDGIVFDVDGVLFDTERVNRRAWEQVSRELGCPHIADHYLECVGRTRADDIVLVRSLTSPDFPVDRFFEGTTRLCLEWMSKEVPVKPGARELLEFLKERQIPTALATSTYQERNLMRMEMAGLTHYFQSMTTGDQVARGKPDPEIYRTACSKLGTNPARTIAIEDSKNGILSASAAGMKVIMVPDLIPPTPELEVLLFQRFDSLLDVRDYLISIL